MPPTPAATLLTKSGEAEGRDEGGRKKCLAFFPDDDDDLVEAVDEELKAAAVSMATIDPPASQHGLLQSHKNTKKAAKIASLSSSTQATAVDDDDDGEVHKQKDDSGPSASPRPLLQKKKKSRITITLKRIYPTAGTPDRVVGVYSHPMPSPLEKFFESQRSLKSVQFLSKSDPSINITTADDVAKRTRDHAQERLLLLAQSKLSQSTPDISAIKKARDEIAHDNHAVKLDDAAMTVPQIHHDHEPQPGPSDNLLLAELQRRSRVRRGLPIRSKSDVTQIKKFNYTQEFNEPAEDSDADDNVFSPPATKPLQVIRAPSAMNTTVKTSSTLV